MDYSTPKRQLKSAIKKKSRYAKCDDLDEEDDESLQKTVNFEARVQTQKTTTNFSYDKENDGDDDDAWFSNAKELVKRPPPTPSTPFHFANDFFDNVCESDLSQTQTVSSECGGFCFNTNDNGYDDEDSVRIDLTPVVDNNNNRRATTTTKEYVEGQRDAYKDAFLHETLPLQKLVQRQKQKVEILHKQSEKQSEGIRKNEIVNAVLVERNRNIEKMGFSLVESVEKLKKEVDFLSSAEKIRTVNAAGCYTTKAKKFLEKCAGLKLFSRLESNRINKKLFVSSNTNSRIIGESSLFEDFGTALALTAALEVVSKIESSSIIPTRAPIPIRIGIYCARIALWSSLLGVGHRELSSASKRTFQLLALCSTFVEEEEKSAIETRAQRGDPFVDDSVHEKPSSKTELNILKAMAWLYKKARFA